MHEIIPYHPVQKMISYICLFRWIESPHPALNRSTHANMPRRLRTNSFHENAVQRFLVQYRCLRSLSLSTALTPGAMPPPLSLLTERPRRPCSRFRQHLETHKVPPPPLFRMCFGPLAMDLIWPRCGLEWATAVAARGWWQVESGGTALPELLLTQLRGLIWHLLLSIPDPRRRRSCGFRIHAPVDRAASESTPPPLAADLASCCATTPEWDLSPMPLFLLQGKFSSAHLP